MPSDETWHAYPADVPREKRAPCSFPGCDQPSVAVLVKTWVPTTSSPGPNVFPETTMRPYCEGHAADLGWDGVHRPMPAEHLNAFQRLVVRVLDHGEEGTP